jgi:hypothetical protein
MARHAADSKNKWVRLGTWTRLGRGLPCGMSGVVDSIDTVSNQRLITTIRKAVGVLLAFVVASGPAFLTVVGTQAARVTPADLSRAAITWFLLFAVGSALGLLVGGAKGKTFVIGVLSCACGGATAALVLVVLLITGPVVIVGGVASLFAIPLLMPWAIGGVVFSRLKRTRLFTSDSK